MAVAGRGAVVADGERGERRDEVLDVDLGVLREEDGDGLAVQVESTGLGARVDLAEQRLDAVRRDVGGGGERQLLERRAGEALDLTQAVLLARGDERERLAGAPGAPGAADPVHVDLRLARRVEVHDETDAVDVEPAGRDVGGDQHVQRAAAQALDDLLALALGDVAADVGGGDTAFDERAADLFGRPAGTDEHDGRLGLGDRQDPGERPGLVPERHDCVRLLDGGDRRRLPRRGDLDGVRHVLVGHAADRGRHGRGEQCDLALDRGEAEDLVDVLGEAHAQHLVALVQDKEAHILEVQRAALDVVDDTTRGADDDLRAAGQGALLRHERRATVDRDDLDAVHVLGKGLDRLGGLHRELAGRGEHEGLHPAELRVDRGEERQTEGGRLAGSRLGDTRDVAALEERRDRLGLDRGRLGEAEIGHGAQQGCGEVQVGEAGGRGGAIRRRAVRGRERVMGDRHVV